MKIELAFSGNNLNAIDLHSKIVIVIDILRATTSMTTALNNRALSIISVAEIEKAVALKKDDPNSLLCGERNGVKIDGFDKGNSPFEFSDMKGMNLIFSSTNGSQTIEKAKECKKLYLGSFNNLNTLVNHLITNHSDDEIILACSGKNGKACIEDTLFAGTIVDLISIKQPDILLDDSSVIAKVLYENNKNDILTIISNSDHGKILANLGFKDDIKECCNIDTATIIPFYDKTKSKIII